jgi:hypothetical protein
MSEKSYIEWFHERVERARKTKANFGFTWQEGSRVDEEITKLESDFEAALERTDYWKDKAGRINATLSDEREIITHPDTLIEPLRCKLGFHKWSAWSNAEIEHTLASALAPREIQYATCLLCRKLLKRDVNN